MSNPFYASGHTACSGCGQSLAVRLVLEASGKNTIVCNNTGCLEVFSTKYPESAFEVPFVHSLFENCAAVASGVEAALKQEGKDGQVNVIAQAGDGGTADIGLQALSGMLERGHNILYVCYDNEAYMNTGIQRSGLTPYQAFTTTSPRGQLYSGNARPKKPMPEICNAHGIPYVATASVAYPMDVIRKVKKAHSIRGPKYIQIHVPCPLGWAHAPSLTPDVARLAIDTGLYPIIEYENGSLAGVRKIKPRPVEEYLKVQGRYKHVLGDAAAIKAIQEVADSNIRKYGLKAES